MSLNTLTNQTLALAGISQASYLVQQLATTGSADQEALSVSIASLLKTEYDTVGDIYGGLVGVKLGLEQLHLQISNTRIHNPEQARYAASLVFLEQKLASDSKMLNDIYIGIDKAQYQAEQYGVTHENVLANLGDVYHHTLSTVKPRIMVNGDQQYLQRNDIVNKIRALLLAGIRSAILWKQCGGSRWRFLFFRHKLQTELERLLSLI